MQKASLENSAQFIGAPVLFVKPAPEQKADARTLNDMHDLDMRSIEFGRDFSDEFSVHVPELNPLDGDSAQGWKTYNFEVADHHTYIADDLRVHNTSTTYTLGDDGTIETITGPSGENIAVQGSWTPSQAYHYGTVVNVDNGDGTTTPTLTSGNFFESLSVFARNFADLIGLDGRFGLQGTFAGQGRTAFLRRPHAAL
ncbi:MAG: hypothetical protein N4A61_16880 [Pelagimonas sp.]|jgi:hypothetical protein|nr:hypothetical protein [Pelagimonas sp.]